MKQTFYAPAKINIVLRVLGRRTNGYHDLLMLNEKVDLCDEINIEAGSMKQEAGKKDHASCFVFHASDVPQIVITCNDPTVPCDETNLCYKAVRVILCHSERSAMPAGRQEESHEILRSHSLPQNDMAVNIHITKHIPVAAGLGGGSSDAAAVLKGLNKLLELNLPVEKLSELGVKLGADVPFFLYDEPAICEGIGDKITTLSPLPNMWILLINPGFPVSTKWVYEEFDNLEPLQLTEKALDVSSLPRNFKGLRELADVVHNDLELVTIAKYPEIEQIKKILIKNGAVCSWMSGSGPTVVGMFDDEKTCAEAAKVARKTNVVWRVIETRNNSSPL